MRGAIAIAVSALALQIAACLPTEEGGNGCSSDAECGDNFTCTNTAECARTDELIIVRMFWTVDGVAPSPTEDFPCTSAGIGELSISFDDRRGYDEVSYRPVPCELGRATYDKMPPFLDRVQLTAWSESGAILDSVSHSLQIGENTVDIDLQP